MLVLVSCEYYRVCDCVVFFSARVLSASVLEASSSHLCDRAVLVSYLFCVCVACVIVIVSCSCRACVRVVLVPCLHCVLVSCSCRVCVLVSGSCLYWCVLCPVCAVVFVYCLVACLRSCRARAVVFVCIHVMSVLARIYRVCDCVVFFSARVLSASVLEASSSHLCDRAVLVSYLFCVCVACVIVIVSCSCRACVRVVLVPCLHCVLVSCSCRVCVLVSGSCLYWCVLCPVCAVVFVYCLVACLRSCRARAVVFVCIHVMSVLARIARLRVVLVSCTWCRFKKPHFCL